MDNKSALTALKNITHKFPTITLLFHILHIIKVTFIWISGHVVTPVNENAGNLAKQSPYATIIYSDASPENLKFSLKMIMIDVFNQWWKSSKYVPVTLYLGNNIYKWTRNRKENLFTALAHTLSYMTENRIYKFKFRNSPPHLFDLLRGCWHGVSLQF